MLTETLPGTQSVGGWPDNEGVVLTSTCVDVVLIYHRWCDCDVMGENRLA